MNIFKKMFFEQDCYSIGIRKNDEKKGLLFENNFDEFFVMPITKKNWYADPIVFEHENEVYLFCEVFDRKTEKGYLGVTKLDGIHPKPPVKILEVEAHLSYPCVFEHKGSIYMIPETTTNLDIELYRATEFPYKWEYVTDLLKDDEYADSTFYSDDNVSLLLTFRQCNGDGSITKLKVYEANEIEKGIVKEYQSCEFDFNDQSRGAGKLFWYKGKLFRPAQDCSLLYGYALNFFEAEIKNNRYDEKFLCKIKPEQINLNREFKKKLIGMHTYAITDEYEIIDVKFNSPVFSYQVRRIYRYIKRKLFKK